MSRLRLTSLALFIVALSPHHAAAQNQNPQSPIGSIVGGLLRNALISQAQNAWSAYNQNIVACINSSGTINVPDLINQGILPTDSRLSPLIQQCQNQIAAQQAQAEQQQQQAAEQQQQAEAAAQQAAQQQAQEQAAAAQAAQEQAAEQARQQADADTDAKQTAAEQIVLGKAAQQFSAFKTGSSDPNDVVAALLNYTCFGANSGTSTAFWMRKPSSKSIYIEYEQGVSTQSPAQELQELDVSKIDSSTLYVQQQTNQVVTTFGKTVFAVCPSCSVGTVQSKWVSFFQTQTH